MNLLTRKLFPLCLLLLLTIIASLLAFEYNRLKRLSSGYIQPTYNHGVTTYQYLDKRPESWINIDELKRITIYSFVVSEDGAFFEHPGLDFEQIQKALEENKRTKKIKRGASTITQQVAKNLFLSNERTFIRKGMEAVLAVTLERFLTKERILEIYLNIVELGEGVYGIKEASKFYFNKRAEELTPKESAFLAMLLPSPRRYSISYKRGFLSPFARSTIHSILIKLAQVGQLGSGSIPYVMQQKMSFEKYVEPFFESAPTTESDPIDADTDGDSDSREEM